jgi:putative sigma-54 modulation protein
MSPRPGDESNGRHGCHEPRSRTDRQLATTLALTGRSDAPGKGDTVEIRIHGIHTQVDSEIRDLVADKLERAAKVFDETDFVDVEFTEESNPRLANERVKIEITALVAGHTVRVENADVDQRAAFDKAVDVFERNLRRLKERLITRNRRSEKRLNGPSRGVEEGNEEDRGLQIERVKQFSMKPMTPEEAALQMETLGHSFYLFLNAETDGYAVLYRRRGGTLGLIEPQ